MKLKKILAISAALLTMSCMSINSYADKLTTQNGLKYIVSDDGKVKELYTGWVKKGNNRYYYKNGVMKKNCWLNSNGVRTYLLQEDGACAKGWIKIDNKWHYFDETTGKQALGTKRIHGKEYAFSSTGEWDGISEYDDYMSVYFELQNNLSKDDYSGVFFERSALIVMSKNDNAVMEQTESLKSTFAPIVIRHCKYSLNELEAAKAKLDKNIKAYDVKSIMIDETNNCIVIKMDKSNKKLDSYIKSLGCDDIVQIKYGDTYIDFIDD